MERRNARFLASNVLILSLLLLLIAQSGSGIKNANAAADAWSVVSSPNVGTGNNYLYGVSLADATNVWAVGSYFYGNARYRTLALKWNGTTWSQETTPNPYLLGDEELYGVDARTTSDVWAVGNVSGNAPIQPIILRRIPGFGWVNMSVPYITGHSMYLRGVSAVSANLAWAVGSDGYGPLIYKWNGSAWSIDTPPVGLVDGQLHAVSATASNDVWAVGSTGPGSTGNTLIIHWNGTQWQTWPSPNPGTVNNGLSGVKAVSTNLAYAVGYSSDTGSTSETLALKWNGSAWSQENSDSPDTADRLEAVDVGGTQTWAVGEARSTPSNTLTERRDSTTGDWNAVTSPNPGGGTQVLHGVAVDPALTGCTSGNLWAVGDYAGATRFQTLIMQYTVTASCSP